jgi:hypothetical protein
VRAQKLVARGRAARCAEVCVEQPHHESNTAELSKFAVLGAHWSSITHEEPMHRTAGSVRSSLSDRVFRALVFDYDGTLSSSSRCEIPPTSEVSEHLQKLAQHGCHSVACIISSMLAPSAIRVLGRLRETHRAQPGLAFDKLIEMPRNVSQARRNAFPRPWPYAEAENMNTGPCDASCRISIASSKRPFMSITWSRLLTFTSTFSGFGAYFVTIACTHFLRPESVDHRSVRSVARIEGCHARL